jgi:hypothetical protein
MGGGARRRPRRLNFSVIQFVHRLAVHRRWSEVTGVALYEPVVLNQLSNQAMTDQIGFGNIGLESHQHRSGTADFSRGFDKRSVARPCGRAHATGPA